MRSLYEAIQLKEDDATSRGYGVVFYELGSEQRESIELLHTGYNVVITKIVRRGEEQLRFASLVTPTLAVARRSLPENVATTFARAVYEVIAPEHSPRLPDETPTQEAGNESVEFFQRAGIPREEQERWPIPFHTGGLSEYIRQHPRAKSSFNAGWMSVLFLVCVSGSLRSTCTYSLRHRSWSRCSTCTVGDPECPTYNERP